MWHLDSWAESKCGETGTNKVASVGMDRAGWESSRVMGGNPVLLVAGICEFVQLFIIYYVQRLALFATCADLLTRVCNDELKQIYQSSPAETAIEFDTLPQPTAMLRIQGRIATTPSIQFCQRLSSLYAFLRAVPYSSF
jgi:hypothetical protein